MARPKRSQIISAQSPITGKIEKWPIPDHHLSLAKAVGIKRPSVPDVDQKSGEPAGSQTRSHRDDGTEARASSHKEGFDAGYQEGVQVAQQEFADQQQQLIEILRAFENPARCLDSKVAQELLALSVDIARCVVQKEIESDESLLSDFVSVAVKQLPASTETTQISALPEELARLKKYTGAAFAELDIAWVEDPAVESGKFVVSRANSVVNGGVEAMLQSVLSDTEFAG